MNATLQFTQHPRGILAVRRFAEQFGIAIQIDERIRAEHEAVGKFFGDNAGFAIGVDLGHLPSRELFVVDFRRIARDDLEVGDELVQQFLSAGGSGGQNHGQ